MGYNDSIDKIIKTYFACLNSEGFEYKGKVYSPKMVVVSPNIFRTFRCPGSCGACCQNYTMDWLPEEKPSEHFTQMRTVQIDKKSYKIFSNTLAGEDPYYCRFLNVKDGRCAIHKSRALSCDFEPLRFKMSENHCYFGSYPYGRGWNMKRISGERGALCYFGKQTFSSRLDVIRKLKRLNNWFEYFEVKSKLGQIISDLEIRIQIKHHLIY